MLLYSMTSTKKHVKTDPPEGDDMYYSGDLAETRDVIRQHAPSEHINNDTIIKKENIKPYEIGGRRRTKRRKSKKSKKSRKLHKSRR